MPYYPPPAEGAPDAAEAEQAGRVMIGAALDAFAQYEMGLPQTITLIEATEHAPAVLAGAVLWMRTVTLTTSAADGHDPLTLGPNAPHMTPAMFHGWVQAHHFLCGYFPYAAGGLDICCIACLYQLTAITASACAHAVREHLERFGLPAPAQYVRDGGALPIGAAA